MAKKANTTLKIQFTKVPNPWYLAYAKGDVVALETKQAKEIIAAGYAVEVEEEADTNLPDPKTKPPKEKPN